MIHDIFISLGLGLEQAVGNRLALGCGRAGLEVVVDDAEITVLVAAVHGAMHPVEENIVHESEVAVHADARIAAAVAGKKIVQKGAVQTTERAAERVVVGVERLAKNGILNRDVHRRQLQLLAAFGRLIHVAVHGHAFVEPPARGDVINHDVARGIAAKRIVAVAHPHFAAPEAHVADDHVVRLQLNRVAGEAHAVTGRGVAGDGEVRRANAEVIFQPDDARDVEDDDARAAGFTGFAKTSRPAVVEVRDDKNFSTAPAERIHATAPRAGKRGDFRLRQFFRLAGARQIRLALRRPFFDGWHGAGERFVRPFVGFGFAERGFVGDVGGHARILGAGGSEPERAAGQQQDGEVF